MRNFFFILKSLCGGKSANTPPSEFSYASHGIIPVILKPLALVLMFVFAGVGNAWGEKYTWTCTSGTFSTSGAALSGASSSSVIWTASITGASQGTGVSGEKCVQIAKNTGLTLSTPSITGTISSIEIQTWGSQENKLTCAVGSYSRNENISASYTSSGSKTTFSNINASGTITLTWASASKAFNVRQINITYSTAAPTTCATPTISLAEGTYTGTQSVTLGCSTTDATIRYTTDGTDPTASSTVYSAAISVEESQTIKAKAFKEGLTASEVASAAYTIKCAVPIFSVNAGTYNNDFTVELSTTFGTSIYYTTDNSAPTTGSTLYSGAINVNATQTIKAIAVKENCENSAVASATYTLKCAQPTLSLSADTYEGSQNVTLNCTTTDAVIRYTLDGNDPTETSDVYSTAINIPVTKTLMARAFKTGYTKSEAKQTTYTIKCAQPTASLAAGTYAGPQDITLSTEYGDAIYYTTSTTSIAAASPSPGSVETTLYTGPIHITTTTKIKAIATKDGCTNSNILGGTSTYLYTIQYNVSWMVNGAEWSGKGGSATVNGGSHITTLPTAPTTGDFCGDRFMGWTDATDGNYVHGTSNLYTTASGFPNATGDQVFYAVFADYAE